MQPKLLTYLTERLSANGFALVTPEIAAPLSPHLWATRTNCAFDLTSGPAELRTFASQRGAKLLQVSLDGIERRVPLLAMSEAMLAERIEWILGRRASAICPLIDEMPEVTKPQRTANGEPIPHWPCNARTEALRAAGQNRDPIFETERKVGPLRKRF